MEFSRVDEWKSAIQIFLNFYTEQSSGFEDAHKDRSESTLSTSKGDWAKGEKPQNSWEITGTFSKWGKKPTIPVHTACWQKLMTKPGPTWYVEYYRNCSLSTYLVPQGLLGWGWKRHLLVKSDKKIFKSKQNHAWHKLRMFIREHSSSVRAGRAGLADSQQAQ